MVYRWCKWFGGGADDLETISTIYTFLDEIVWPIHLNRDHFSRKPLYTFISSNGPILHLINNRRIKMCLPKPS